MVGMPRSGTTVLSEAISIHESLGWFSSFFEHVPFFPWIAVLDRVARSPSGRRWFFGKKRQDKTAESLFRWCLPYSDEVYSVWKRHFGKEFLEDYLVGRKTSAEQRYQFHYLISKILRYQGRKRFFTKNTGPTRLCFLNSVFPDAFFVHVIRDPRAVVNSLLNVSFWKEGGGHLKPWWKNGLTDRDLEDWENSGRSPVALAAIQWRRIVETAWEEKKAIGGDRYIEIRYEDFVETPHDVLKSVFVAVGLKDSQLAHRYLDSVGKLSSMNYKFRTGLCDSDIRLVEKLTGKTAEKAGYVF